MCSSLQLAHKMNCISLMCIEHHTQNYLEKTKTKMRGHSEKVSVCCMGTLG